MQVQILIRLLKQYDNSTGNVFSELTLTFDIITGEIILQTDNVHMFFDTVQDLVDYLEEHVAGEKEDN